MDVFIILYETIQGLQYGERVIVLTIIIKRGQLSEDKLPENPQRDEKISSFPAHLDLAWLYTW